jgi:ElaB/YqjD/DUF883 family membrane-anchored ribosome-binding protein
MSTLQSAQDQYDNIADATADTARSARRAGSKVLDKVIATANDWRDEAAPVVERVKRSVQQASDRGVGYVRDEPVRTLLMAAAAGVAIYAVVRLLSGRNDR